MAEARKGLQVKQWYRNWQNALILKVDASKERHLPMAYQNPKTSPGGVPPNSLTAPPDDRRPVDSPSPPSRT
jgi:hypothetical protein